MISRSTPVLICPILALSAQHCNCGCLQYVSAASFVPLLEYAVFYRTFTSLSTVALSQVAVLLPFRKMSPSYQDRAFPHATMSQDTEFPFPHVACISYFRSPPKPTLSPPFARPIPPTPRKMRANNRTSSPTAILPRQRRPPSASSIPRPISGSSRRATPTRLPISNPGVIGRSQRKPSTATLSPRSSTYVDPPSSFKMSRPIPPRVDSLLPYRQRHSDLSGVQQQLQPRNYSTHSLASTDSLTANITTSEPSVPVRRLPKSKTVASLVTRVRDLTPQRQLVQPLGPAIPRVQSFTNVSCFSPKSDYSTPSPVKPYPSQCSRPNTEPRPSREEVDIMSALRESRLTDDEIKTFTHVEADRQANKNKLRHSSGDTSTFQATRQHRGRMAGSFLRKSETSATINLSANDIANTARLEEQNDRKLSSGLVSRRRLFINATLANEGPVESPETTPASMASTGSGPEEEWDTNIKHVSFAE